MSLHSAFLMPKRKKVREKGRDLVQERRKRGLGDKKKGSKKSCHDTGLRPERGGGSGMAIDKEGGAEADRTRSGIGCPSPLQVQQRES